MSHTTLHVKHEARETPVPVTSCECSHPLHDLVLLEAKLHCIRNAINMGMPPPEFVETVVDSDALTRAQIATLQGSLTPTTTKAPKEPK